jgi:hypothetical protein
MAGKMTGRDLKLAGDDQRRFFAGVERHVDARLEQRAHLCGLWDCVENKAL